MKELRELAIFKKGMDVFCARIDDIVAENSRLSGLRSRIADARLTPK